MYWIVPLLRLLALVAMITLTLQGGVTFVRVAIVIVSLSMLMASDPAQKGPDKLDLS